MAALGGETSRCLELVQAWGAHADDLDVLALGPRSAADEVTVRHAVGDDDEQAVLGYALAGPATPPLTAVQRPAARACSPRPCGRAGGACGPGGIGHARLTWSDPGR